MANTASNFVQGAIRLSFNLPKSTSITACITFSILISAAHANQGEYTYTPRPSSGLGRLPCHELTNFRALPGSEKVDEWFLHWAQGFVSGINAASSAIIPDVKTYPVPLNLNFIDALADQCKKTPTKMVMEAIIQIVSSSRTQ